MGCTGGGRLWTGIPFFLVGAGFSWNFPSNGWGGLRQPLRPETNNDPFPLLRKRIVHPKTCPNQRRTESPSKVCHAASPQPIADPGTIYNLGPDTNLVRLLDDIRDLSKNGELDLCAIFGGSGLGENFTYGRKQFLSSPNPQRGDATLFQKGKPSDERQEIFRWRANCLPATGKTLQEDLEYRRQKREVLLQKPRKSGCFLGGKKLCGRVGQGEKGSCGNSGLGGSA